MKSALAAFVFAVASVHATGGSRPCAEGSKPCDHPVPEHPEAHMLPNETKTPEPTANSSHSSIDGDCDGCAGQGSQDKPPGDVSDEKPIDNVVVKFLYSHSKELKSQAQELGIYQDIAEDIKLFAPIRYKTQIVAGTNWFIKVQCGTTSRASWYADVEIFEPLPFRNETVTITRVQFGVPKDAPIFPSAILTPLLVANSSDIDRCSVCTDDCAGCISQEKPIDNMVVKFLYSQREELKLQAQALATQEGITETDAIKSFVPIRYKTQIVAGTNWFIKVQFGATERANSYADVEIFEPLPFRNETATITRIKFGVPKDAPIFPDETLMV